MLLLRCSQANKPKDTSAPATKKDSSASKEKHTGKDFSGEWEWAAPVGEKGVPESTFTLTISSETGTGIKAQYCAIAHSGGKTDCSNEQEYNVTGILNDGIIKASFYSFFDPKNKGEAEITLVNKNSLKWKITKKPAGEFYAPMECTLVKAVGTNNAQQGNKVKLPFDFEEYTKICGTNPAQCKKLFPSSAGNDLPDIKKLILQKEELSNPEIMFRIDNGVQNFETYLFEAVADAETQTLINVSDNKIIASLNVGYNMGGEDKSFQTFQIDPDLSILIYDKNYATGAAKLLSRHQIKHDGTIDKIK